MNKTDKCARPPAAHILVQKEITPQLASYYSLKGNEVLLLLLNLL